MLQRQNKTAIVSSIMACAVLFTGCSALDTPIHDRYASGDCILENMGAASEPYHIRFEVVSNETDQMPGIVKLEETKMLEAGAETLVFTGEKAHLPRGFSEESQIWVLASLGESAQGNLCLKTRTATRPAGLDGNEAVRETLLTEEIYNIELVGACGEAILEAQVPGIENAKLRISSAPQSTAEYLINPERAMNSSCAQLVDSLPPEQGDQLKTELRTVLGV